jgi:hypothetical protein
VGYYNEPGCELLWIPILLLAGIFLATKWVARKMGYEIHTTTFDFLFHLMVVVGGGLAILVILFVAGYSIYLYVPGNVRKSLNSNYGEVEWLGLSFGVVMLISFAVVLRNLLVLAFRKLFTRKK